MNGTVCDTITAAIQVFVFFLKGHLQFLLYSHLIMIIVSRVTKVMSHIIRVQKEADLQKAVLKARGLKKQICKKGSSKQEICKKGS